MMLLSLAESFLTSAVVLIPVLVLLRRRLSPEGKDLPGQILFSLYLAMVYALVGLPGITYVQYLRFQPNLQLIPFAGMGADLRNTILNVCLFVPLGLLLPLLRQDMRSIGKTAGFGLTLSLAIELVQILPGRATDVNDLLANTAGTVIGYGLSVCLLRWFPGIGKRGNVPLKGIFLVTALAMFLVQPILSDAVWRFLL